ncbi:pre-mRNA-splicing factor 38A-like [Acropora muricata]|uniref:pre-mRNA-splicing factor 38A-like n=1 Tax=Acropora muricata TaxID=159855 RepID=UPI0034E4E2B9
MANRTVSDAKTVKGTNPQYLVEKIIRSRIYENKYWKEQCFALSAELLVDKAMELDHVGGTFGGNIKPTPFLCLVLKMLQIQPEKEIVVEFIKNEDYKYVRALGAIYMRLVGTSLDCYNYLEPLYNDYRKIRRKNKMGQMELGHMDEFIDELLREERACDVILPRIQKRQVLESSNQLEPRRSLLDDDLEEMESDSEEEEERQSPSRRRSRSRSPSPKRAHRDYDKSRKRSRSPGNRRRSRSRSPRRRRRSASPHKRRGHRSRSRSPYRRRSRSRSRSRSPHRRRHRSKSRSKSPEKSSKKSKKSDKPDKKKESESTGMSKNELEVKEANELRAKLGLKPLKP